MAAVGTGTLAQRDYIPGKDKENKTKVLESGSSLLQTFAPIKKVHQHLCAFHFYAHDMTRQLEAHHYYGTLNEDVRQGAIYDSDGADARLIGIEYVISDTLFLGLPEEEKRLWHSHEYEVRSGIVFCPGLPYALENGEMVKLAKTYGKAFHFWQFDKGDALPLGPPQLMASFTEDGQLNNQLAKNAEERYGVSFAEKKKKRLDIRGPEMGRHPSADHWRQGRGFATLLRDVN